MGERKLMKWMRKLMPLWAFLFYLLLAIVMTYPLIDRMSEWIVGRIGDNIYFVWMIGWLQKALFELHVSPFDVWFLNYPEGWNMAYTEISLAQLLTALPFSLLYGETFAYNATMLLSFALSGLGMYLWVRSLTSSESAGLVAGMIFTFSPYHLSHYLIGHLNLSGIQWFPFFFWGFFDLLKTKAGAADGKIRWKPVLVAGISLGLIAHVAQYYVYMGVLVSAFLVLLHVLMDKNAPGLRTRWAEHLPAWIQRYLDPELWKHLLLMGMVSLPLIATAIAPYVMLNRSGGLPDRNLGIVSMYSASPTDFLLPSTDHFLFGKWVSEHFNRELWIEATLYVGVITIGLSLVAYIKQRKSRYRHLLFLLLGGMILTLILAMGTDLHWNSEQVRITLPGFLAERLGRQDVPILLPGYLFFRFMPFFAKMRALMRFGLFLVIFGSVSAGIGCAWLLKQVKQRRWQAVITTGLLLLVFLDFYPGPYTEFAHIQPRPVDAWLATQPERPMVQLPFSQAEDQEHTYYTLFHNKPYIGGFFNAFPPPQYKAIYPVMMGFPDESSVELMRELGVYYVLVDVDEYDSSVELRRQAEALGLVYETQIDDQMIFFLVE